MSRKEALSSFIQQIHGRPVVVKLNSGVDYRGKEVTICVYVHKYFTLSLRALRDDIKCTQLPLFVVHRHKEAVVNEIIVKTMFVL